MYSPRFLCRLTAFCSTCWSRGTSERSPKRKQRICRSNSGSAYFHVSWLLDFIFYPKLLYKSLHQSFFYSFITILPSGSESGVTLDYCTIFPYTLSFHHFTFTFKHLSLDCEKTMITAMYHGRWFAYMILPCPKWERRERDTCSFRSPWVTLPLNLFFPTHFVLFPSALIWAVDGTVCPAEYALYRFPCDLYVVYICK